MAAVQKRYRKTLDVLLRAGAEINARGRSWAGGRGVLDVCAPELAPFLIERGARVDAHSAARLGMLEKLQQLVASESSLIQAPEEGGQTPAVVASNKDALADPLHNFPFEVRNTHAE